MNPSRLVELVWFEKILEHLPTSFTQLCRWVKARWNGKKKGGEKHNPIKSNAFIKKIELYGGEYVITIHAFQVVLFHLP